MRIRPLVLFPGVSLGLLLLVLASACVTSSVAPPPRPTSQGPTPSSASISSEQQAPLVPGVQRLDLSPYTRIPLVGSQLEVSSFNLASQDKDNLVQPVTVTYWHIKVPKDEIRSWVVVDMKVKQAVAALGVLGRGNTDQMWSGYRAVLEASDDRQSWTTLAKLGLSGKSPQDEWTYFLLPAPEPYRYYRLSIHDWSFLSMARLSLYVPAGTLAHQPASNPRPLQIQGIQRFDLLPYVKIPLESSQLKVSSVNDPSQGKDNLVKPGAAGFWHVKLPRLVEERAWVLVDLGVERPVSLLRVRPRAGLTDQMWYGYTADLEASNDGQNWATLAVLGVPRANLTDDWVYFLVGNLQPYRYYRLSVWDGYFYSLARLELYRFR